ncbi:hypothetical protein QL285_056121 [Trifolium repens]|nr:hypothetical protein QL285_077019 [Trifolium repens]KAK2394273.1 hypothetical protein QL285_056121 [Trifolium repens]
MGSYKFILKQNGCKGPDLPSAQRPANSFTFKQCQGSERTRHFHTAALNAATCCFSAVFGINFKIQNSNPPSLSISKLTFLLISLHESTILDGTSHNLRFSSQSNPTTSFKTHPAEVNGRNDVLA